MSADSVPYLGKDERLLFPDPDDSSDGLVGAGGNLSPGMLLSAYEQGVFPWYSAEEPILWWSPQKRAVILPGSLHLSRSMKKHLAQKIYTVTVDTAFKQVITRCRDKERPGQEGTWITTEMVAAYVELNALGHAHSYEVWDAEGRLAGGLYGIRLGSVFCGESMFSDQPNSSKTALVYLYDEMMGEGMTMIDCQILNPHIESLGAVLIDRDEFLRLLEKGISQH